MMAGGRTVRHIYVTSGFRRAAKRAAKRDAALADQILKTVAVLRSDMFDPALRSHRLRGDLTGCWSCSVNYSLRIVFEVGEPKEIAGLYAETIVLLTVGTHDEVY